MVRIVELRISPRTTEAEIAEALSITDRTVRREWEKARLWPDHFKCYFPGFADPIPTALMVLQHQFMNPDHPPRWRVPST